MSFYPGNRVNNYLGHVLTLPGFIAGFFIFPEGIQSAMDGKSRRRSCHQSHADLVDGRLDAEARHIRQTFVHRPHGVPEIGLGATGTGMTRTDRPTDLLVVTLGRTGVEGSRSLAAHPVEAETLAMSVVAPVL